MKKVILTLLLASSVTGLALAQPAPSEPQSPSPYPQSSTPQPSAGGSTGTADKHTLMKQCVAQEQERASSSGMSKKDIQEFCKKQVTEATTAPQNPTPRE